MQKFGCISKIKSSILTQAYQLLYHQLSWSYDLAASLVSIGNWSKWTETGLHRIHPPKILEIGFGPGHLLKKMAASGLECTGIDASSQMCHKAEKNLKTTNDYAHFPVIIQGSSGFLPFPDHVFNSIIATFPSNYIFIQDTFKEASRVLVENGNLVIVLSAVITGSRLWERIIAQFFSSPDNNDHLYDAVVSPLANPYFRLNSTWINLPTSKVLLIEGIKIPI
jgi:ubiquinone/menaquinone biosynthesis C-methylase UbiE